MTPMLRMMVFDRLDTYKCDVDPALVRDATYVEEINGEHSVTLTTTQEFDKTDRLLMQDGTGKWREYVITGIEETHDGLEYYAIWSLQYDLSATFINGPYDCGIVPGHASVPQAPRRAMEVALGGTKRWQIGTITVTTMAAASFYRRSGWEGLQTVPERWGGELDATITVGASGVTGRAADLLAHTGTSTATRRFDYGHDLKSIKRTVSDDVWPCRIVPLGKAMETEAGGYTRRPSIESVNGGVLWLQDDTVANRVRILNPDGEYEYPTVIVLNDTYEKPADLKAWALEHISEYTRPQVTYEASVVQLARAGLNAHGVALGDDVVVVDRDLGTNGLRISARVIKIAGSLLDPADMKLTIGNAPATLSGQFTSTSRQVAALSDNVERTQQWQATAEYMSALISRINEEANALGGYTYITQGEGLRTYDVPVSDPLVGSEASKVIEVKGGLIRIADSRTQAGDWDWKTLIVSGHIATDLITVLNVTAGFIGSTDGRCSWDLDGGTFEQKDSDGNSIVRFDANGAYFGGEIKATSSYDASPYSTSRPMEMYWSPEAYSADLALKLGLGASSNNPPEIPALHIRARTWASSDSNPTWNDVRITPGAVINSPVSADTLPWNSINRHSTISSTGRLALVGMVDQSDYSKLVMSDKSVYLVIGDTSTAYETYLTKTKVYLSQSTNFARELYQYGTTRIYGNFTVSSAYTKSKVSDTEDYGSRLLYCYEMASPVYGDVGSGELDEDGICYVSIDPIFGETVSGTYQTFLQACGRGELWVDEKRPDYFVVRGTPGLPFDWEIKAQQADVPNRRLDEFEITEAQTSDTQEARHSFDESIYADETDYVTNLEQALYGEGGEQ